jgi:4'-phosphopantetheinyl transferase
VLRQLLGAYTGVPPAELALGVDGAGRPWLQASGPGPGVCFSVSHSGRLALYAFAREPAVGVDVQLPPTRRLDMVAVATRALGSEQGHRLAHLAPEEREREFLRLWTRHEAALKCRGRPIDDAGRGAVRLETPPWVVDLRLDGATAAAVALANEPAELRCFRLARPEAS